jgi:hypothetical protein
MAVHLSVFPHAASEYFLDDSPDTLLKRKFFLNLADSADKSAFMNACLRCELNFPLI